MDDIATSRPSTRPSTRKPKTSKTFKEAQIQRQKNKEYSKEYLKTKQARNEKPNSYPKTRLILIKDFFRTPDLHKAIAFFLAAQIVIATVAAATIYPNIAGALNLLALIIGILIVGVAVKLINRRQAIENNRRPFKIMRVISIVAVMFAALTLVTIVMRAIGIEAVQQPNQASLENLVGLFPVVMIFTMVIVSPVVEEFVFRELLPYATGPSLLSFGISSLIFVALHAPFGLMGWASYGILSAGFLYARLKDNNLYTAIAVHIIWNALTLIL